MVVRNQRGVNSATSEPATSIDLCVDHPSFLTLTPPFKSTSTIYTATLRSLRSNFAQQLFIE
jgi:hypothetical protein